MEFWHPKIKHSPKAVVLIFMTKKQIPLMRAVLLEPFLQRLNELQIDTKRLLSKFGMKEQDVLNPEKILSATTIYRFLNEVADQLDDPYVGARVGAQAAKTNWVHTNLLMSRTTTFGEFLNGFMATKDKYGKSADYQLETNGKFALLRMQRTFTPDVNPAQADATAIGFFIEVLSTYSGESWDTNKVIAIVCNSSAIPVECLPKTSVINGGKDGFSIRFPANWLFLNPLTRNFVTLRELPKPNAPIDISLKGLVKILCKDNLANANLEFVANNCGMHPKKLQRILKSQNTSFSQILDDQRREHAQNKVGSSSISFTNIAYETGFDELSNFSRAFKRWTGQTPAQYR